MRPYGVMSGRRPGILTGLGRSVEVVSGCGMKVVKSGVGVGARQRQRGHSLGVLFALRRFGKQRGRGVQLGRARSYRQMPITQASSATPGLWTLGRSSCSLNAATVRPGKTLWMRSSGMRLETVAIPNRQVVQPLPPKPLSLTTTTAFSSSSRMVPSGV